jgi:hypothetical protein
VSRIECSRELEVLDAIASGRWPDRAGDELHGHVAACGICSDVAVIATLYNDDFGALSEQTRLPSAGLVWWKSEIRARREAVRIATRPISLAAGLAAVCLAGVLVMLLRGMPLGLNLATVSAFLLDQPLVLWLLLGAIIALTPIALYFVYSDD